MGSVECGMGSVECGMGSVECGIGSVECGMGSVECGIGSVECGIGSVECGMAQRRAFFGGLVFQHLKLNHRNNYLNLIRYMEKLIRLQVSDKVAVSAFRESLKKEEILSEKTFFLGLLPPTPPDTP